MNDEERKAMDRAAEQASRDGVLFLLFRFVRAFKPTREGDYRDLYLIEEAYERLNRREPDRDS